MCIQVYSLKLSEKAGKPGAQERGYSHARVIRRAQPETGMYTSSSKDASNVNYVGTYTKDASSVNYVCTYTKDASNVNQVGTYTKDASNVN